MTPTQQWASNLMTRYEMLVHPEQLDETAIHLVELAKAILAESEDK